MLLQLKLTCSIWNFRFCTVLAAENGVAFLSIDGVNFVRVVLASVVNS